jgi:cytidylate kinase
MNSTHGFEKCLTFINCQLQAPPRPRFEDYEELRTFRAITISRQAGSGGHAVAEKLAERLQSQEPADSRPWVVFDRNLVEKVLEDHNLPARLARFMPEDRISQVSDTMAELFGLHPPSWILVRQTSETILHLAQLGHVILIGRGSNVITCKLPHVLHVRLVGSLQQRVKRLQELEGLNPKEALRVADREDLARRRYLKQFFDKSVDDPLLYHLVINTDLISFDEAARMIALAAAPKALALAV